MTVPDSVTIARATYRRLVKQVQPDGTVTAFDAARTFDLIEHQVANLEELELLLRQLEQLGRCCVVRGKPADPERCKGVRRLLYPDAETGDPATLVETPRRWLALDFDSLPKPDWIEISDLLACACVAIRKLPVEFQKARFIVQATASHGLKPGIRIRLWCWLSRPVGAAELKFWLRATPLDTWVLGAAQVIYTAAPVLLSGAVDPLPTRIAVVPGHDVVPVPPPSRLKPPDRRYLRRETEPHGNISGLIIFVETARIGNRSNALYWAARRVAENTDIDAGAAATALEAAAIRAGLSQKEAAATVQSGLRHGGGHG
jgi:hypothetical protein